MNTTAVNHGVKSTTSSDLENTIALTFDMTEEDTRKCQIQKSVRQIENNAEANND